MPTQNVTCCKNKLVLVRVYVEKPRKKRVPTNHHQTFRQAVVHSTAGEGYDRRAELLRYSQRLRESARSAPSTPLLFNANNNGQLSQIVPPQRKPKSSERPSCFGNWKLIIPGFLGSFTNTKSKNKRKLSGLLSNQNRMVMKNFESQMKRRKSSSIFKVFSTIRKRS